jgi:hypothetical protein
MHRSARTRVKTCCMEPATRKPQRRLLPRWTSSAACDTAIAASDHACPDRRVACYMQMRRSPAVYKVGCIASLVRLGRHGSAPLGNISHLKGRRCSSKASWRLSYFDSFSSLVARGAAFAANIRRIDQGTVGIRLTPHVCGAVSRSFLFVQATGAASSLLPCPELIPALDP